MSRSVGDVADLYSACLDGWCKREKTAMVPAQSSLADGFGEYDSATAACDPVDGCFISARLTGRPRQANKRPRLAAMSAQEAVSPWQENPLWWRFECAWRELDKFHDIKGLR
jgi:hypothetical protein